MNVGELFARLNLDTKPFDQGLRGAEGAARSSGNTIERALGGAADGSATKFGGALDRIKGMLSGPLIAAAGAAAIGIAAAFAGSSMQIAGDFEAGMNRFESVVGSSMEAAGYSSDDFRDKFLDLGASTQFSAAQAQDAAINLAKGGVAVGDVMGGALEATLNLAAAGELGLAPAAEIVAKQLGVWASTGVDAAEVADLMAQAANASTVDVDELALGLANVGGIAKTMGLSFEETVTTMALLAPGFSSAADAGTSLKVMLSRLQPTTEAQSAAMAELNLLSEDGKSLFFDQAGSFIGMERAAKLLNGSLAGLSEEQKAATLQAIFGQDAFRAAALLAEQGAEGYNAVALSMRTAGSAAQQAEMRQRGFNFAMESLGGSVETMQIHLGSILIPLFTALIERAIIPAVNAISGFVGGLYAAVGGSGALYDGMTALMEFVGAAFVPVLTGVVIAAIVAYSGSIVTATMALAANTAALATNAIAAAAAVAPYALIAAAIGGVVWAYNDFNSKVAEGTQKLLEGREFWNASSDAIERHKNLTNEQQAALSPMIATMENLRGQLESEIESLARRKAAGLVTQEQYAAEMAHINVLADSLKNATDAYVLEEAALVKSQAASHTATAALQANTEANQRLASALPLTTKEVEELAAAQRKLAEDGAKQLDAMYAKRVEMEPLITKAAEQGLDDRERAELEAYGREMAALRTHLGTKLAEYTANQVALGNMTVEKGNEVLKVLDGQYGSQVTLSSRAYLEMASDIDGFVSGSVKDLDAALTETETNFYDMKAAGDAAAKEYIVTQINNLAEGKVDADEFVMSLRSIPAEVTTTVRTKYVDEGAPAGDRRHGGEVDGSHAMGLDYVPFDGYVARLHRGERVLTKAEADAMRATGGGGSTINNFHLTAQYANQQSEGSLRDDVRTLQLLGAGL